MLDEMLKIHKTTVSFNNPNKQGKRLVLLKHYFIFFVPKTLGRFCIGNYFSTTEYYVILDISVAFVSLVTVKRTLY